MPLALRKPEAVEPRTIPEWLASRDAAAQHKAENALAGMGRSHATRYLVCVAAQEEAKRRQRYKWCVLTASVSILVPSLASTCLSVFQHVSLPDPGAAITFVLLIVYGGHRAARPSPLHLAILRKLAASAIDATALPVFVDALWKTEETVKETILPALTDMLALFSSSRELSRKQWATLASCLTTRTGITRRAAPQYQKLAVAILGAMERTAYTGFIDSVNRLRTDPPRHLNVPEVLRAAQSCWDNLRVLPAAGQSRR